MTVEPADPDSDLVLTGVRVVSLATNLPGPLAARRLADLGAQVTKVEPPGGDALAHHAPEWYHALVAGMDVRTLDLKSEPDRAALDGLLATAEVLLTASRPSALARLGLSWSALHTRFPRLHQVAVTGGSGPGAEHPGHDLTYQAQAGLVVPPQLPVSLFADLMGAERALSATLTALLRRCAGGGTYRQVTLSGAADALAAPARYGLTGPVGPLGGRSPTYRVYQASDGYVALAAVEPQFAARVGELLGPVEGWADRFAARSCAQWVSWARDTDVPLVECRRCLTGPADLV